MTSQHTLHETHSAVPTPHFEVGPDQSALLKLLEDPYVEIDDIIRVLGRSKELSSLVQTEAEAVAKTSMFGLEVRSLKHALTLIGLKRTHEVLSTHKSSEKQELKNSA